MQETWIKIALVVAMVAIGALSIFLNAFLIR